MNKKNFLKALLGFGLMVLFWMPMTAQAATLRGDADKSGAVNISDAICMINYLSSGNATVIKDMAAADVNDDRNVNISDVIALINYLSTGYWELEPYEPVYETFTVSGVTFRMLLVKGGTFTMGGRDFDPYVKPWEFPVHEVTLSDFYIGETEVTQALWKAVMGSNPSWFQYKSSTDGQSIYTNDLTRPVESVTYANCQSFISKLNQKTGKTFRMLTEAEWEFAARGGIYSKGCMYPGSDDIDEVAWHSGNSSVYVPNGNHYENMTHSVGTKAPNELGIYDMGGNVGEWCSDWYGEYTGQAQTNPTGPTSGNERIVRGGSWGQSWRMNRVTWRLGSNPGFANVNVGLRVVLVM